MIDLTGKTAIVTGGSRGIARRIANLLAGQPIATGIRSRAITTGPLDQFTPLAPVFADHGIDQIDRF